MKEKQAWSILWAGSSPGNAAQQQPFAGGALPAKIQLIFTLAVG